MRHVAGILIGLAGTAFGVAAMGFGLGVTAGGLDLFGVPSAFLGAPLLLIGGLILGLVLIAGRLSRCAPLISGLVLLAVSGYALAVPSAFGSSGLDGAADGAAGLGAAGFGGAGGLIGTQLGTALGMLMLCGALAVRGRRRDHPQPPPQYPPTQQYPPPTQPY